MRAMVLDRPGERLRAVDVSEPVPSDGQVLVRVHACGVCRTDLHVVDGELPDPKVPLILGHQVVATVEAVGRSASADGPGVGDLVGIPWLAWTCGACRQCQAGRENLCERARFTGYTVDGGFAELAVADARYCFPIPGGYPPDQAAPLLCAGLIGYRSLRMAGDAERVGVYGFGAAGHIVTQVATHEGRHVFAFTRPGDAEAQAFALELGCVWAGAAGEPPPEPLDAVLLFAPAGEHVPMALRAVAPGGVVVCGGIHMSDIPSFPYELLWGERVVRSVANLTRQDATEFLALAPHVPVRTHVEAFPLAHADEALQRLRAGAVRGAVVLTISTT